MVNEKQFIEILKSKGLKITNQRLLILEVLANANGKHYSTEEIYDLVKLTYPEIGLATVYRTIQLLLDLEIIDKINFDDGFVRYELSEQLENNSSKHQHHHLICKACGQVFSFKEDLLELLEEKIKKEMGFQISNHEVKFYGYCKSCQDKNGGVFVEER